MKRFLAVSAFLVSGFAMATSIRPMVQYHNIVNINVGYGTTNTLFTPNEVLRPFRGDLLRVSIPASCGATTIGQLSLVGRTLEGYPVALPAVLLSTQPSVGMNRWIYQVNGGRAATVREIGLLVTTLNPMGCQISFEQGNNQFIQPNECNEHYACPMHIDNTQVCDATPRSGFGQSFVEYREGADNSCTIASRLKKQICAAGSLPSQFEINCR